MEKADIKKKIHLALVALLISVQRGTAFSTSSSALTSCASSTANISFNFSIDAGETIAGNRIWFFGAGKIAESDGTTLTPVPSYSSRLTAYGSSGISLSNITVADAGTYAYVIVLLPNGNAHTATTVLSVKVAPLAPPSGCQVSATQSSDILTCAVNTDSGNCGTPSLNAFWVNSANTSNQIKCNVGETYQCCATSAALTCYSGSSNDFCKLLNCTDVNTTTTKPPQCNLELGIGLGLGLGIPIVITIIVVVIFICTDYKHAYTLGLVLGLGLGITFHVGWIIIASLILKGNECKLELGLGLGLGSGMPGGIACIIAVISLFKGTELGKGILTGLLCSSVIGIIVVYLMYEKLKPKQTNKLLKKYEQITPDPTGKKNEQVPLEPTDNESKTNNSGSSAVSREQIQVQMENKGVKDDDEERPTAVHTRTQNKAEPNTNSKQTNDRQQPVPPENTGFEDTPTFCRQPQLSQNGEIKDQNLRGISATIGDTPDLASETPQPIRLRPLTPKQATVQKEDASEEPRKKRKKKKKKD